MTTNITREQFLQALRDHPDWREEIRAQILGEELMRLPAAFQAFVVGQQKFNDEMREFRDDMLGFRDGLSGAEVTAGDRISFARADLIIEADRAGETTYLAVEISYTVAERDQRRAQRNAQYLSDHTGCPSVPVVAGVRHDDELRPAIDHGDIIWVELEEP